MMRHVLGLLLFVVGLPFMAVADTRAVSVTDAWSRPATGTGVVYATLHNNAAVADHLIGASSPLARHIGLHQTSEMKMSGMSTSMGNMPMAGSMTSMKSVPSIPVPAHGIRRWRQAAIISCSICGATSKRERRFRCGYTSHERAG